MSWPQIALVMFVTFLGGMCFMVAVDESIEARRIRFFGFILSALCLASAVFWANQP